MKRKYWLLSFWHYVPEQGHGYSYEEYYTHFRKAKAAARRQKALGWTGDLGGQKITRVSA